MLYILKWPCQHHYLYLVNIIIYNLSTTLFIIWGTSKVWRLRSISRFLTRFAKYEFKISAHFLSSHIIASLTIKEKWFDRYSKWFVVSYAINIKIFIIFSFFFSNKRHTIIPLLIICFCVASFLLHKYLFRKRVLNITAWFKILFIYVAELARRYLFLGGGGVHVYQEVAYVMKLVLTYKLPSSTKLMT